MTQLLEELAERIRGEVEELDRIIRRTGNVWSKIRTNPDQQDIYVDSVALNLHGFYSGLEKIFELTAKHIDKSLPTGQTWHRDLLKKMSEEVPDVRPAVFHSSRLSQLDELRRFRHLVRNTYTFNLVPEKVEPIAINISDLWYNLREELLAFSEFLINLKDT